MQRQKPLNMFYFDEKLSKQLPRKMSHGPKECHPNITLVTSTSVWDGGWVCSLFWPRNSSVTDNLTVALHCASFRRSTHSQQRTSLDNVFWTCTYSLSRTPLQRKTNCKYMGNMRQYTPLHFKMFEQEHKEKLFLALECLGNHDSHKKLTTYTVEADNN